MCPDNIETDIKDPNDSKLVEMFLTNTKKESVLGRQTFPYRSQISRQKENEHRGT
jgi:hypothetical protein